jgi:hypothetical protein
MGAEATEMANDTPAHFYSRALMSISGPITDGS